MKSNHLVERLKSIWNKISAIFQKRKLDDAMNEEIRIHVEMQIQENLAAGKSPEDARREALLSFGGVENIKETCRDQRGFSKIESFLMDLRYAARMLYKHKMFTVVAILTLAIGIGANTAIFNFVNTFLLRPPFVEGRNQLVEVWTKNVKASSAFEAHIPFSFPDYAYYRDNNTVFSDLVAYDADPAQVSWNRNGQGELVQGQFISWNYFSALGVKPFLGRYFNPRESNSEGGPLELVLSHRFWSQQWGGEVSALGKPIVLNGITFTVIGIAPPEFTGMLVGITPDFWAPISSEPLVTHYPGLLESHGSHQFIAIGRLKSGVTFRQAQAELKVMARQLEQQYPDRNRDIDIVLFDTSMVPGPFRGYVAAFTAILQAVVALVLTIACANAANLFLAQATARRREMAVRAAIGASRQRLFRQTLTECMLIAFFAGVAGLAIAQSVVPLLLQFIPPNIPIRLNIGLDWRVILFTVGISALIGLAFGLITAIDVNQLNLMPSLKETATGSEPRRSRLRRTLIIGEVAVCLTLLIAGGLCFRSLLNAYSIDPGIELKNRLAATINLKSLGYTDDQVKVFYNVLLERVNKMAGVKSASIAKYLPLEPAYMGAVIKLDGLESPPGEEGFGVQIIDVGPEFFQTMGVPVLKGRDIHSTDREGQRRVVVINEAFAKRFWPGQDAIGKIIKMPSKPQDEEYAIVGVVKTGKYRTLSEPARPVMFRSFFQNYQAKATLVAEVAENPSELLPMIRSEVSRLDPNIALVKLESLEQHLSFALFPVRVTGIILSVIGILGLGLAVIGLSGVIAYSVAQRTKEIALRMALGARRADVFKLIIMEGARLSVIGIILGIAGSYGLMQLLSSLLFGVSATDTLTYAGSVAILAVASILASYFPARRAVKIDPMVALRQE